MLVTMLVALAASAAQATEVPPVRAQADLFGIIGASDYPTVARTNGEQGTVAFQLSVTPEGRTSDCRVTASSGSALLDETTCRLMIERARFTPARDSTGHPVADVITQRLIWALPPPPPPIRARARANLASYVRNGDYPTVAMDRHEQGLVGFELEVSSEGRVTDCRVLSSSGSSALDGRTCQIMVARARFEPARDMDGNPAPDIVSGSIGWRMR